MMMVNDHKNNMAPWKSTIPQQMPWMNNYEPTSSAMQFGAPINPQQQQHLIGTSISGPQPVDNIDAHLLMQQQLPSLVSYPTATTSTQPITACPTSSAANCLFTSSSTNAQISGVTATTQSYPVPQNIIPTFDGPNYGQSAQHAPIQPLTSHNQTNADLIYNPGSSLTHLPPSYSLRYFYPDHHNKRRFMEVDDDQIKTNEPPTKQLLSESKLFKQFGSLRLNGAVEVDPNVGDSDDDLGPLGSAQHSIDGNKANSPVQSREEFNRYVYLLFKDKKTSEESFEQLQYNSTLDRLAREERDKLSKAVVLWNPPLKNIMFNNNDDCDGDVDDDDESLTYSDHRDFLRRPKGDGDDSIIITEISSDDFVTSSSSPASANPFSDEVMLE